MKKTRMDTHKTNAMHLPFGTKKYLHPGIGDLSDTIDWCKENLQGRFLLNLNHSGYPWHRQHFEFEEDKILFLLTWGDLLR